MKAYLEKIAQRQDLTYEESKEVFSKLFAGELTPVQAGALLMGLRSKGEKEEEVQGAVEVALSKARQIQGLTGVLVDTCGTGGDGKNSFNCSTAVAFFLADQGIKVVKHGNKAISSSCGSADVVEALGFPLVKDENEVVKELEARNFVFLFAPYFHPAFAHIAPVRQQLGIRTLFNIMGPLLNPANPTHQIVGVPQEGFMELVAKVLARKNLVRGCVVHGAMGFDELTPCGPNQVYWVEEGKVSKQVLDPAEYGFEPLPAQELVCASKEEALSKQKQVLRGEGSKALKSMVALNLGVMFYLLEVEGKDLKKAFAYAREVVDKGLQRLIPEEQLC